jgi:hypothetical protein
MSLYNDASLLLIPSGYKSGKVYCQKPTNGDGDLTFTRASTATRVNSDGEIELMATGVPRLDYSQGSCPSLLLEPQRTNLALSSDDLTNATYWTIIATRFTSSTTTSILGANNAFIFTEAIASDSHNVFAASGNRPTSTSGATYTISAYFKQGTRRYAGIAVGSGGSGIHIFLDTTTWAITDAKRFGVNTNWVYLSSQIVLSPNSGGWYRLSVTFRTDAALTLIPSIFASNVSTSLISEPSYLGDGSTIICGQPQLELGAYATSYIPTTTTTVTRIADVASKTGISSLIGQTEGTLFIDFIKRPQTDTLAGYVCLKSNNSREAVVFWNNFSNVNTHFSIIANNAVIMNYNFGTLPNNENFKLAASYKSGETKVFKDGLLLTTLTNSFDFNGPLTNLELSSHFINRSVNESVNQVMVFPTALSDADAISLTTL